MRHLLDRLRRRLHGGRLPDGELARRFVAAAWGVDWHTVSDADAAGAIGAANARINAALPTASEAARRLAAVFGAEGESEPTD